jgi:hypothetical protein
MSFSVSLLVSEFIKASAISWAYDIRGRLMVVEVEQGDGASPVSSMSSSSKSSRLMVPGRAGGGDIVSLQSE